MTLLELIAKFRADADDLVAPYLFSDVWVKARLNEAVEEAVIRGRLLHESSNSAICQIDVVADTHTYSLHDSLYEIDYCAFQADGATRREKVRLVSREDLDELRPDWRESTDPVGYAVQTDLDIRLVSTPSVNGTLFMEGYRLPMLVLTEGTDTPEIHAAHHKHLVNWALFEAFSIPDSDSIDPRRAANAEAAFTAYFGERPDSDLRRSTQHDNPHHNRVDW